MIDTAQLSLLRYDEEGQLDQSSIVPVIDGGTEGEYMQPLHLVYGMCMLYRVQRECSCDSTWHHSMHWLYTRFLPTSGLFCFTPCCLFKHTCWPWYNNYVFQERSQDFLEGGGGGNTGRKAPGYLAVQRRNFIPEATPLIKTSQLTSWVWLSQ